ncbi:MAG: nitroreductase family protein [Polyangiales bacterium]|nr:nitroreductase family protein [Myxococcales bacterium]MCB9657171.1 nitroreductase family protein [Sandaracinaceae bacterium]
MDTTTEKPSVKQYEEPVSDGDADLAAFARVVETRRSVRRFHPEPVPDAVVERCLDLALLAPTSSNLQCWEFYRVVDPDKKRALAAACLGQPAATTAPELIVAVARIDTWRENSALVLRSLHESPYRWPKTMHMYYEYITKVAYSVGPLNAVGALKRATAAVTGLVRPIPRGPASRAELVTWAVKTSALACENLMLAFRAAGYDTCPMEGMDEVRVKKIVGLSGNPDAIVTMVISAGKRAPGGVYGPRLRLPRARFVHTV